MKNRTNIKKLLITCFVQGFILLLSVLPGFVLPEKMGPTNYGYWQVYLFYLAYLNIFGLGFNDGLALTYGGYEYEKLPYKRIRASIRLISLYSIIICVLGLILCFIVNISNINKLIFAMLVINIPLTCIQCIILTLFLSVTKTSLYNAINLLLKIFSVTSYFIVLYLGHISSVSLICVDTLVRLIITILCIFLGRRFIFGESGTLKEGWTELYTNSKSGIKLTIALIISMLMPVMSRWIVEQYESMESYGIYSFAISLLSLILSFTNVLGTVLFPLLKRLDPISTRKNYYLYCLVSNLFVIFALFLYIPLYYLIQNIMIQYTPALQYLPFLLIMCIPLGRIQLLIIPFYKAYRLEKDLLKMNIIGLLIIFISLVAIHAIFKSITLIALFSSLFIFIWTFAAEMHFTNSFDSKPIIKRTIFDLIIMFIFCLACFQSSILYFCLIYSLGVSLYCFLQKKEIKELLFEIKM